MTSYLSLKPAPPTFSTADIIPGAGDEHRDLAADEVGLGRRGRRCGLVGDAVGEEALVVLQRLEHLGAVEVVGLAAVLGEVGAVGPRERHDRLPGAGAAGLQADAPLGAGLGLHGLGHRLEALPVGGRRGDAGLLGEVGAVVDQPGLDVPRHAERGAVRPRWSSARRRRSCDLSMDGGVGSSASRPANSPIQVVPTMAASGVLSAGDRGRELVVGGVPRDRGDLDLDAGVGGLELLGERGQLLALGAHRPDGDGAGGLAAADVLGGLAGGGAAAVTPAGRQGERGGRQAATAMAGVRLIGVLLSLGAVRRMPRCAAGEGRAERRAAQPQEPG